MLKPGEIAKLVVTLRLKDAETALSHRTSIQTDDPRFPNREFFTTARLLPRVKITGSSSNSHSIQCNEKRENFYEFIVYSLEKNDGLDLNRVTMSSKLHAAWEGAPTTKKGKGGVVERSRTFRVEIAGDRDAATRSENIHFSHNDSPVISYAVGWKTIPSLEVRPSAIIVKRGGPRQEVKLEVTSKDKVPFSIEKDSPENEGIAVRVEEKTEDILQSVVVSIEQVGDSKRTVGKWKDLRLRTTHPRQSFVSIPIFLSGENTEANNDGK